MNSELLSLIDEVDPNEMDYQEDASSSSGSDFGGDDTVKDPSFVMESNKPRNLAIILRRIQSDHDTSDSVTCTKNSTRKRKRNPEMWEQNIRKRLRESGKEYQSAKGKINPRKNVLEPCKDTCVHLCTNNFSHEDREEIHKSF
ncbi:uncharacterized protein LOC129906397 [Episyrphus balteatus]|uniref:uncharacterized protein LOC129906397 n=1 Tax=Episyrphus balteatus TaxID=286459 RepID=UPI0024860B4E|nr:uncharacterized protein LOC129906397 [Episyrphus balteatus]